MIDTNVLVSGIIFFGPPSKILKAWRNGKFQLVLSADILLEYIRVGHQLSQRYPDVDMGSVLALVALHGEFVTAPPLESRVCVDSHDDKFLACASAAGISTIISGDKHLLEVDGFKGIAVVSPRVFLEEYLSL